jgi:hypothetical protein
MAFDGTILARSRERSTCSQDFEYENSIDFVTTMNKYKGYRIDGSRVICYKAYVFKKFGSLTERIKSGSE